MQRPKTVACWETPGMRVRGSGRKPTRGECLQALKLKKNDKRQHLRERESIQRRLLQTRPVIRGHSPERKAAEKVAMKKKHGQIESRKVVEALSELRDILVHDEELERRAKLTLKLERKRKKTERELHQKSEAAVRRREAFRAKKTADEDAAFFERQQNFKKRLASLAAYQAREKALLEERCARQRCLRQMTMSEKKNKIALASEKLLLDTERKVEEAAKKSKELLLELNNETQERIANKRSLRSRKTNKIRKLREKLYQDETEKIELSKVKFIRVAQRLYDDFECRDRQHELHVEKSVAWRRKTYNNAMEHKKKALNRKIYNMELADANSELLLKTINEQMMHEAYDHKIMMKDLKERARTKKRSIEKNLKNYVEELLDKVKKRDVHVDLINSNKRAKSIRVTQDRTSDLNRKRRFIKTFEVVLANPVMAKPLLKMDIDLDDPEAHTKIDIGYILDVLEGEVETSKQASTRPKDDGRGAHNEACSRTLTARKQRSTMTFPTSTLKTKKEHYTSPNKPTTFIKKCKLDSSFKIVDGYEGLDEETKTTLKKFEDQSSSDSEEDPDMLLML